MRHVLAGVLIALLACSLLWAALPFTDAFTNTNGTVLTTHNAAWAMNTGTAGIYSNYLVSRTAATLFLARVTGETFSDDQYAQCTAKSVVDNYGIGPAVRVDTGGANTNYHVVYDVNEVILRKTVAGTNTTLQTTGATTVNENDVFRLEVVGNSQAVYLNGSGTPLLSASDTAITTGVAGVRGFNYAGSDGLGQNGCDDFEAGNVSAGSSAPIRRRPIFMFFTLPELSK